MGRIWKWLNQDVPVHRMVFLGLIVFSVISGLWFYGMLIEGMTQKMTARILIDMIERGKGAQ